MTIHQNRDYLPVEDYGIIGDLETAALVSTDGSIDFMCFPYFDSPSVFAGLLDHDNGGYFSIGPYLNSANNRQLYLPDSNVLLTRFLSDSGVAEISDFMHLTECKTDRVLVRRVKSVHGSIRFQMHCCPRFDYARSSHEAILSDDGLSVEFRPVISGAATPPLRLKSSVPLVLNQQDATAEFTLETGDSATFTLERADCDGPSPTENPNYAADSFKDTLNYWRQWVQRSSYQGRWRETVNRSALALKLLTSRRHGSIIASPTFGLPEKIGGVRNWDYRFCWIRDGSFILYALMRLGYTEEAHAFMGWITDRFKEPTDAPGGLQIMYTIDGSHELPETELDNLDGYKNSRPVRIGNAAFRQLQLDIYGELMDTVYMYDRFAGPIDHDLWIGLSRMLDWISDEWATPDHSIWEVRSERLEYLYTRVMNWVALDRGVRLARKRSLPCNMKKWIDARDEIYHDIHANFWNSDLQAFVQAKSNTVVDASSLVMPLVRFIGPRDPRWLSSLKAIEKDLIFDSLVYRYPNGEDGEVNHLDGIQGDDSTFNLCSFWYVECLSRSGDLQQARFLFEKMLGYANHLGLYGEELGHKGDHLGNFPQGFTHVALISAAFDLDRRLNDSSIQ